MAVERSEYSKVAYPDSMDVVAYTSGIPYSILQPEISVGYNDTLDEFRQIEEYYKVYKCGARFISEGSGGNYIPSQVRFKTARRLINKEARFMFGQFPKIEFKYSGEGDASDEISKSIDVMQKLVEKVLKINKMSGVLVKAAKDCFIGKRIAIMVDFSDVTGVHINFYKSTYFLYETEADNSDIMVKFVGFSDVVKSSNNVERRILKKKYTLENEKVFVEEILYNGAGQVVETIIPKTFTEFERIPAVVIINDGLLGDDKGESEIEQLQDLESAFSKLANADIDSERKNMNPVIYTVDIAPKATKNLSSGAGAYWDLVHDENIDSAKPSVGVLSPDMKHSEPLKTTLTRIESEMFKSLDMPNVDLETMSNVITSGKGMKAIYWDLISRCNEKFAEWRPALEQIIQLIIDGWEMYPEAYKKYAVDGTKPNIEYDINIELSYAIIEDEESERSLGIQEVNAQAMSRKTYIKKWQKVNSQKADEELEQIAFENQMLDSLNSMYGTATEIDRAMKEDEDDAKTKSMAEEFVIGSNLSDTAVKEGQVGKTLSENEKAVKTQNTRSERVSENQVRQEEKKNNNNFVKK